MSKSVNVYKRHRFPPAVIQFAVWLYHRFNLSHRDIEDLLAERGIEVSYESVRLWCNTFGPLFSNRLGSQHPGFGDTFFIDEVFVTIAGQRYYLWRAVDQDADVSDGYCPSGTDAGDDSRHRSPCERPSGTVAPAKLVSAAFYGFRRARAFECWNEAAAA
jgi:putative transposase